MRRNGFCRRPALSACNRLITVGRARRDSISCRSRRRSTPRAWSLDDRQEGAGWQPFDAAQAVGVRRSSSDGAEELYAAHKTDFEIAVIITAELTPKPSPTSTTEQVLTAEPALVTTLSCPCPHGSNRVRGSSNSTPYWWKSDACYAATNRRYCARSIDGEIERGPVADSWRPPPDPAP